MVLPSHVTGLFNEAAAADAVKRASIALERGLFFSLGILAFVLCGPGLLLDRDGIHCSWYGIPYRHIKWETIKQIGLVPNGGRGFGILVTIEKCPRYVPKYESLGGYLMRNHSRVVYTEGSKKNIRKFEKFYGRIDYRLENVR